LLCGAETDYSCAMPNNFQDGLQQPAPRDCPQCRMPVASGMGKAYCPQCGWNRGEAEKQTRLLLRLLPLLVMVFDAPLIAWIFVGHAEVAVLAALCALSVVPAILVVLVVQGKMRLPFFMER
jgi:hypothetical protein